MDEEYEEIVPLKSLQQVGIEDDEYDEINPLKSRGIGGVESMFRSSGIGQAMTRPLPLINKSPYDLLPDFRSESQKSPVDVDTRAIAQGVLQSDDDKLKFLKKQGYNAKMEDGNVTVDGKEIDPSLLANFISLSELGSEALENIDTVASLGKYTPLAGAAIGTGVGAVREGIRSQVTDEEFEPTNILYDSIPFGIGGALDTYGGGFLVKEGYKGIKNLLGTVNDKAIKPLMQKGLKLGEEGVTFVKGTELFNEAKQAIANKLSGYGTLARELGVPSQALNKFKNKSIEENLEYLVTESPEFAEAVLKPTFFTNKAEGAINLYKQIGSNLEEFYSTSDLQVPLQKVFDSEPYLALRRAINDPKLGKIRPQLRQAHDDFVSLIYENTAVSKLANDPKIQQAANNAGVDVLEFIATGNGGKPLYRLPTEVPADELIEAISTESLPALDFWLLRRYQDGLGSFGKNIDTGADVINDVVLAQRGLAGALREGLESTLPEEIAKQNKVFHNLVPVVESVASKEAKVNGVIPTVGQVFAGAINSPIRRAAVMTRSALVNPTTRSIFRKGLDSIDDFTLPARAAGQQVAEAPASQVIGPAFRGTRYQAYNELVDRQRNDVKTPNITGNYSQILSQGQPKPLSRDPERVGKTPEDMALIEQAVKPNTALLFKDAVNSNDPLKRRIATVKVMQEAPELFEPSMYGLRSLISEGDRFVLGDPSEAKFYRQTIKHLKGLGKVSENWYTQQLSALNDPSDMTIYPRPDVLEQKPIDSESVEKEPSQLDRIKTVAGQRRSYDY